MLRALKHIILVRRPGAYSPLAALSGHLKPYLHHTVTGDAVLWGLTDPQTPSALPNLGEELPLTLVQEDAVSDRTYDKRRPCDAVIAGHAPLRIHEGEAVYGYDAHDGAPLYEPRPLVVNERGGGDVTLVALNAARERARERQRQQSKPAPTSTPDDVVPDATTLAIDAHLRNANARLSDLQASLQELEEAKAERQARGEEAWQEFERNYGLRRRRLDAELEGVTERLAWLADERGKFTRKSASTL